MLKDWLNKKQQEECSLTFCFRPDGVSMAEATAEGTLLHSDYIPLESQHREKQLLPALAELVSRYKLFSRHCRWVLVPGQYQLLMTDALNVPDDEMREALRWRLKGLLDHAPENTVLDIFKVPNDGMTGKGEKVFVVASQMSLLQERIKIFQQALLVVDFIDISDLAMRNILCTFPQVDAPIAMLSLDHGVCKIILQYRNNICLIRQLALNFSSHGSKTERDVLDPVLLEIQRSFDYCQSELKLVSPRQLLLTPRLAPYRDLISHLKKNLNINVSILDINQCLTSSKVITQEIQENCLNSLGCSLYPWTQQLKTEVANAEG